MLNHAFLITAHAHLPLLEKIIELLSAPNHYFFINIDKKTIGGANLLRLARKDTLTYSLLKVKNEWKLHTEAIRR